MKRTVLLLSMAGICAGAVVTAAGQATVQDKIYSAAQAKQGVAVYDEHCAACHDGGTMGPELWGEFFIENWKSQDAAAFFDRIKTTMPAESPGILSDQQVLDVVAYVLQQNGFPAGDKAIPDAKSLTGVKFVSPSK